MQEFSLTPGLGKDNVVAYTLLVLFTFYPEFDIFISDIGNFVQ